MSECYEYDDPFRRQDKSTGSTKRSFLGLQYSNKNVARIGQAIDQVCTFLTYLEDYKMEKMAQIYISEIVARNDVHVKLGCTSFQALYRGKCRSPILWAEVGESQMIGLEIMQETTDKIFQIKERLKAARDR
ncbi:hypothetical protein Tco_1196695 [Tanacetum coccineum]